MAKIYAVTQVGDVQSQIPVGGYLAFPPTTANLVDSGGAAWLRTGVLAAKEDYPLGVGRDAFSEGVMAQGTIPDTAYQGAVTFAAGKFWMTGFKYGPYVQCLYTSIDGISWTVSTIHPSMYGLYGIAMDASSRGVITGTYNYLNYLYTLDGVTWSQGTTPNLSTYWARCATNGTRFLLISNNTSSTYLHSTDLVNWTQGTFPMGLYGQDIEWNGEVFYHVGANTLYTSPDGLTWTLSNTGLATQSNILLSFGGYKWAIPRSDTTFQTKVHRSTDWINWTQVTIPTESGRDISWARVVGSYVMAGNGSAWWISSDMVNWTKKLLVTTGAGYNAATNGSSRVVVSRNGVLSTYDYTPDEWFDSYRGEKVAKHTLTSAGVWPVYVRVK